MRHAESLYKVLEADTQSLTHHIIGGLAIEAIDRFIPFQIVDHQHSIATIRHLIDHEGKNIITTHNHAGTFDPIFMYKAIHEIATTRPEICSIGSHKFVDGRMPIAGYGLEVAKAREVVTRYGSIIQERDTEIDMSLEDRLRHNREQYKMITHFLHSGQRRWFYTPFEGTRSQTEAILPAVDTPGRLIKERYNAYFVPMAIEGSYDNWHTKQTILPPPRFGTPVTVHVGPPATPAGLEYIKDAFGYDTKSDAAMLLVAAMLPPEYHGVHAENLKALNLLSQRYNASPEVLLALGGQGAILDLSSTY